MSKKKSSKSTVRLYGEKKSSEKKTLVKTGESRDLPAGVELKPVMPGRFTAVQRARLRDHEKQLIGSLGAQRPSEGLATGGTSEMDKMIFVMEDGEKKEIRIPAREGRGKIRVIKIGGNMEKTEGERKQGELE